MQKYLILLLSVLFVGFYSTTKAQNFDDYFLEKTLRIDYLHSGSQQGEYIVLDDIYAYPHWQYSKNTAVAFDFGMFKVEVYDSISNKLIYTKQFSTLFGEYLYTEEATKSCGLFEESIIIPFPKNTINVKWLIRDKKGVFNEIASHYINPQSKDILQPTAGKDYPVRQIHDSGNPRERLDIVLIPDGFTAEEMDLFFLKADSIKQYLFATDPIGENKDKINIWAVDAASQESGISDPSNNILKQTLVNSSFNTLNSDRYLMTTHHFALMDVAMNTPFDAIIIVCNTEKYGGGGIYNFYATCAANNEHLGFLVTHEIGHSIFGLADEYYSSEVSVEEFYNTEVEPWEPNITTLVDFESKWKDMLHRKTPVPTPDDEEKYGDKIGVFEGAGYMAKGVYRPFYDCSMKSVGFNNFCPVCKRAITRVIESYN